MRWKASQRRPRSWTTPARSRLASTVTDRLARLAVDDPGRRGGLRTVRVGPPGRGRARRRLPWPRRAAASRPAPCSRPPPSWDPASGTSSLDASAFPLRLSTRVGFGSCSGVSAPGVPVQPSAVRVVPTSPRSSGLALRLGQSVLDLSDGDARRAAEAQRSDAGCDFGDDCAGERVAVAEVRGAQWRRHRDKGGDEPRHHDRGHQPASHDLQGSPAHVTDVTRVA